MVFKALVRYRKFLGSESSASSADSGALAALMVQVDNFEGEHCQYPQHKDDESYTLEIPKEGDAVLKSATVWGALRGLETFSQLVYQEPITKAVSMGF